MIAFIALSALLAVASGQYPFQGHSNQAYSPQSAQPQSYQQQPQQYQPQPQQYQQQPQQYQQQPQQYQPQPQQYQPQPQQQTHSYQPQPQQRSHTPAAVHYVNIGKDLAGDYKFGYDTGKGTDGQSFREETRLPDGTVQGAYGYVDGSGQQRIVKYTAGKDGFQVEGDGIPKAPAAPAAAPQQAQPAYNNYAAGPQNNYSPRGY